MTVEVTHQFESAKADGADAELVKPSDWNAPHFIKTTLSGIVLGRDASEPGDVQELPLSFDPAGPATFTGTSALRAPSGNDAQRPFPAVPGMFRWNTEESYLEIYGIDGTTSWTPFRTGIDTFLPVGATVGWYGATPPTGFLFANGQSIGNPSSGADVADVTMLRLFRFIWNNLANPQARVLSPGGGGVARGISADADWNADRRIEIPDECGRVTAGTNNMGGIASKNRLTSDGSDVNGDVLGASGGVQSYLQAKNQLAPHEHVTRLLEISLGGVGGGAEVDPVPKPTSATMDTGGIKGMVSVDEDEDDEAQVKMPIAQPTIIKNVIIKF